MNAKQKLYIITTHLLNNGYTNCFKNKVLLVYCVKYLLLPFSIVAMVVISVVISIVVVGKDVISVGIISSYNIQYINIKNSLTNKEIEI